MHKADYKTAEFEFIQLAPVSIICMSGTVENLKQEEFDWEEEADNTDQTEIWGGSNEGLNEINFDW